MKEFEELVQDNLEDVKKAAVKYYNRFSNKTKGDVLLDDLIGAGNLALVEAALRFDASKGNKFITFAYYYIDNAIKKELYRWVGPNAFLYAERDSEEKVDENYDTQDEAINSIEPIANEQELAEKIIKLMNQAGLSNLEKEVYTMVWGIGRDEVKNLRKIASKLKISEIEVRRFKQSAERKMKKLKQV